MSFGNKLAEDIFDDERKKVAKQIHENLYRRARRKLLFLHEAAGLKDLRAPPGNRLEALRGERTGQHSIRINKRWRIAFRWETGNAYEVEVVDYH